MVKSNKLTNLIFFFIICFIGIYLRIYQINFDDYWADEIATLWVANPELSFSETLNRSYNLNKGVGLFFDLILKHFFRIFGYDPTLGRLVPLFFGILSIPFLCYLSCQIDKNKSYLFTAFLISINWYLISYSQETRTYSLTFFLAIVSIIFFFKKIDNKLNKNKQLVYSTLYILFTFLGALTHLFFFIIIISQGIFLAIQYHLYKKKNFFAFYNILAVVVLFFIFEHHSLLLQLSIKDWWVPQVEPDFFINYFFSRFFGSKIMGAIYLLSIIYLIICFKKKFFYNSSKYLLLIIILFMSYLLPIIYGFIFQPILLDRYIIFVLIPILLIISIFTLSLNNRKIKLFLLLVIIISTLSNNYLEISKRKNSKPEINKTLNFLAKSNINTIHLKTAEEWEDILFNYVKLTSAFKKHNFKILNLNEILENNNFWQICYQQLNGFDCSLDERFKKFTIKKKIKFHLIEATLYSKNV